MKTMQLDTEATTIRKAKAGQTRASLFLLMIIPVFFAASGAVMVYIGSNAPESSDIYKEGNCTLSFIGDACVYQIIADKVDPTIPGFDNNWKSMSCDVMMPRMSLTQYKAGVHKCYYHTVKNIWGYDITDNNVRFEKPCNTDPRGVLILSGYLLCVSSLIGVFVLFALVRRSELQEETYSGDIGVL